MGLLADGRIAGQHSQPIKINHSSPTTVWPTILCYTAPLGSYPYIELKKVLKLFFYNFLDIS